MQLEDDDSDLFNNSTLVIKFTVENMLSEKKRMEMNESVSAHQGIFDFGRDNLDKIGCSRITFVELPDVTKTSSSSAQDIGFRALESILRFQIKQRKLKEAAQQLSIDSNKIFQSKLTQHLQPQLENHSRLVFMCSASPNG